MPNELVSTTILEGLSFGEGPRWHEGRLYFSDFFRHGVFSILPDGSDEREELHVATQPSGLGWLPDGSMLVVSMTDHRVLRLHPDGSTSVHADISEHCGYWANDMVVGRDGTAYVGNFGFDVDTFLATKGIEGLLSPPGPPTTCIVVLDPSGAMIQIVEELSFPNGMVITPDGGTLIVAETLGNRLSAFTIAPDGTLSERRVFAPLELVAADGICLDADGQVWVANALAPQVLRVAEGGEITATVTTSQLCVACALGGDDRRTLFLMTAPSPTAAVVAPRRDAKVERVSVDTPGAGIP